MSAYEDEDDCCVCCDTLCEKICGDEDEDDDCACCNKCCTCLPGCGKEDTPDKFCVAGGWCVRRDCCGIWCAGISLGVILLTDLTVVTCVITPWFQGSFWGAFHFGIFEVIVCLAFASHLTCMTTCPGTMPTAVVSREEQQAYETGRRNKARGRGGVPVCRVCLNYKLRGVHHCSTCNRCVERMDHHCPWVNNCVGRYNQKYFVLFLFYVMLGESYAIGLFVSRGISCMMEHCDDRSDAAQLRVVGCVVVGFISALFLAFVCSIGSEQWEGIRDDLPKIDRLQKKTRADGSEHTVWDGLDIVMGEPFCMRWFLPIPGGSIVQPAEPEPEPEPEPVEDEPPEEAAAPAAGAAAEKKTK